MGASFRFCSGSSAHTRRTAHEQGPSACGGWEREAAPLAVYSRTQAPREGGGSAAASAFGSVFTRPSPTSRGAGSAGSQCRWRRVHAPKPHEQGAWVLRFGSVPAVVRIHGGRSKSRGRPPAAVGNGRRRRWRCIHAPKPRAKGGRRCRQPVPSAPCSRTQAPRAGGPAVPAASAVGSDSRTQAPRAGGLGAALRSEWGDGAGRRRTGPRAWACRLRRFGRRGTALWAGLTGALGNVGNAKFGGCAVLVCFAVRALRSLETWEIEIGNLGAFGGFRGGRLLT